MARTRWMQALQVPLAGAHIHRLGNAHGRVSNRLHRFSWVEHRRSIKTPEAGWSMCMRSSAGETPFPFLHKPFSFMTVAIDVWQRNGKM